MSNTIRHHHLFESESLGVEIFCDATIQITNHDPGDHDTPPRMPEIRSVYVDVTHVFRDGSKLDMVLAGKTFRSIVHEQAYESVRQWFHDLPLSCIEYYLAKEEQFNG